MDSSDDDEPTRVQPNQQDRDFRDFLANVVTMESIHKVVQVQHQTPLKKKITVRPYMLSMRVVTPAKHPVTELTTLLTTSNQTFSNNNTVGSIPPAPYQQTFQTTISLLAGVTTNMQAMSASLSYNDVVRDGGNSNDKDMAPRILLTYTNVKDEFYECELTFEELSNHVRDTISTNHEREKI
jgi:hypothetical protein